MPHSRFFSVRNGNRTINGELFIPKPPVKGAVIFSHGYNGSYKHSAIECAILAEAGYYAYAFDFPGGSNTSISTGLATTQMTLFTEKSDLLAVYASISSLALIYEKPTWLVGQSQGGCVTAMAAAELKEKLSGIILYYPALMIPDEWRKKYPKVKKIPPETEFWDMKLGYEFFASIHDYDVYDVIKEYEGRALVLYGDQDDVVPRDVVDQAITVYKNADLKILEGEGHGFSEGGSRKAAEMILEFVGR